MQLEHRIVSVHGRDGVGIVLGPGGAVFLREIHQTFVHALLLSVFPATGSGGSDSGEPYRAVRDIVTAAKLGRSPHRSLRHYTLTPAVCKPLGTVLPQR